MNSEKINIAILTGGYSKENEISIKSSDNVYENIDLAKYSPYIVLITKNKWSVIVENKQIKIDKNDFSFCVNDNKIKFDAIFFSIHGAPAENGILQGYFDLIKIPYNCSNYFSSSITFDKYVCNNYLKNHKINCPDSLILNKSEKVSFTDIRKKVKYPSIVKPNNYGSSFGISKINHETDFNKAINKAFDYNNKIIIEEFIDGREITCGLVQRKKNLIKLPLTEIKTKRDFFDYDAKYKGKSKEITPAKLSKIQEIKIYETSEFIFNLLNLKGIVRIDYILTEKKLFFLEINTIPGLSKESIIPKQIKQLNISMKELISISLTNII